MQITKIEIKDTSKNFEKRVIVYTSDETISNGYKIDNTVLQDLYFELKKIFDN